MNAVNSRHENESYRFLIGYLGSFKIITLASERWRDS